MENNLELPHFAEPYPYLTPWGQILSILRNRKATGSWRDRRAGRHKMNKERQYEYQKEYNRVQRTKLKAVEASPEYSSLREQALANLKARGELT
jgi:hypothetical protein